ncbi:unnamed protein product [Paramecium octaurelia]|uniref:Uncharacterized protein n=1 Tax=Paramecium octaurelia TaxID=43137 RepID=A0A8S1XCI6_PAROT|nr:unnamed protein product [Paramecium octaurelia]
MIKSKKISLFGPSLHQELQNVKIQNLTLKEQQAEEVHIFQRLQPPNLKRTKVMINIQQFLFYIQMGACAGTKQSQDKPPEPVLMPPDLTDENVRRIKSQFDDLTSLLESLSQEFKTITDNIIKLQHQDQHQDH